MKRILIFLLTVCFYVILAGQQKSVKDYIAEAQVLQNGEKIQEAVDLLQEAVKNYPEESDVYLHLGLAWGSLGQTSSEKGDMMTAMKGINECFANFEKAAELNPENSEAHFNYGVWGVSVPKFFGKLESSIEHLKKVLILYKGKEKVGKEKIATVYQYLGLGYKNLGQLSDAETAWKLALEFSPEGQIGDAVRAGLKEIVEARASFRENEQKEQKENKDIIALKKKIKSTPEDFNLFFKLGNLYFEEKQWPEAADIFKKAVKLNRNHFKAQFFLTQALTNDAIEGYDERIYKNTNLRSELGFEMIKQLKRTMELDPENTELRIMYAVSCVQMPFFVGKLDEGIILLKEMAEDETLSAEIRVQALYELGFGYRKKGNALWMRLVKQYPESEHLKSIYEEYGLRRHGEKFLKIKGEKVSVTFHLGFKDELEPQSVVWIEDSDGKFVKTLYVSGFSGYAREKQVNLPQWVDKSNFETDGTTGASIDWGKHIYIWDLKDHAGKRVTNGTYRVNVEACWWPSMQYSKVAAEIDIGSKAQIVTTQNIPLIPLLQVNYDKK